MENKSENTNENKTPYQAELFANRLKKKYKELRKWARKNRILSYRLYDRDIPEIPVSLDLYEFLPSDCTNPVELARFLAEQNAKLSANDLSIEADIKARTYAILYLYERPYQKDDDEEEKWLDQMAKTASQVLGIDQNHIIKKMRKHQKGKNQYEKEKDDFSNKFSAGRELECEWTGECGQLFKIDLNSYLDTGLFFDHRPLRNMIRETCSNKDVLNLFCYTGSFSVYAAQGNAKTVESVDLSNTYLAWAKENMDKNGFDDKKKYIFTRADCLAFLQEKALAQKALLSEKSATEKSAAPGRPAAPTKPAVLGRQASSAQTANEIKAKAKTYDIIILDPPTFSNSKNTANILDINKQWPQLVKDCLNILNPHGQLYFSTNSERLKFDPSQVPPVTISGHEFKVEDLTAQTIPNDYAGSKPHRCWKFTLD